MEIGWDDILHDDFSKGIFEMELEDVEEDEARDDAEQDGGEVLLANFNFEVVPDFPISI